MKRIQPTSYRRDRRVGVCTQPEERRPQVKPSLADYRYSEQKTSAGKYVVNTMSGITERNTK